MKGIIRDIVTGAFHCNGREQGLCGQMGRLSLCSCCSSVLGMSGVCLGGGGLQEATVLVCLPLAAPIGLSPSHIPTVCGPERVLVVSMEPPDDLSCLTTRGGGGGGGDDAGPCFSCLAPSRRGVPKVWAKSSPVAGMH